MCATDTRHRHTVAQKKTVYEVAMGLGGAGRSSVFFGGYVVLDVDVVGWRGRTEQVFGGWARAGPRVEAGGADDADDDAEAELLSGDQLSPEGAQGRVAALVGQVVEEAALGVVGETRDARKGGVFGGAAEDVAHAPAREADGTQVVGGDGGVLTRDEQGGVRRWVK